MKKRLHRRTAAGRIYAVFFLYTGYTGCFRCVNVSCLDM